MRRGKVCTVWAVHCVWALRPTVPCSTMPDPLEMELPMAAAARVERPSMAPSEPSIRSPIVTISALSTNPKPTHGAIACQKHARSCVGVGGARACCGAASLATSLAHSRNSTHERWPSESASSLANSSSISAIAPNATRRLLWGGSAATRRRSASGREER